MQYITNAYAAGHELRMNETEEGCLLHQTARGSATLTLRPEVRSGMATNRATVGRHIGMLMIRKILVMHLFGIHV